MQYNSIQVQKNENPGAHKFDFFFLFNIGYLEF